MKTNVKRNFRFSAIFICIITFMLSLMLSVFLYVEPVKAAGDVFVIENGAGVKLTQNGLRFIVKMDKTYRDLIADDNVELWGYIAPVEEFDKVSEYKNLAVKVGGQLDESKIYEKDGFYYANIAMTDLHNYTSGGVKLYEKSFSATFFIKDMRSGAPTYTYAEMAKGSNGVSDIELQNRTQYSVLCSALLDGEKSYELDILSVYGDWLGTENYPIIVSTKAQYDALVAKIQSDKTNDEGKTFATLLNDKHVFVNVLVESTEDNKITYTIQIAGQCPGYIKNYKEENIIGLKEQ